MILNYKILAQIGVCLSFFVNFCFSQNYTNFNKAYFNSYYTDFQKIIQTPKNFSDSEKTFFLGKCLTTFVLFENDVSIQKFFIQNQTSTTCFISKYIAEPMGSGVYSLPLLLSLYIEGNQYDRPRNSQAALAGIKAFILSGFIVKIQKTIVGRQRPSAQKNEYNQFIFKPFNLKSSFASFPSGHTAVAFAVASSVTETYKNKIGIATLSYSLALLCGLSRIHDNKHWASDVFSAACLGISIGKMVSN